MALVSGSYIVIYRHSDMRLSSLLPPVSRFWNCSLPRVRPMWLGTVWKHASTPHMSTSLTTAKSCTTDSFRRPWNLWVNTFTSCAGVCLYTHRWERLHLCLTVCLQI